MAFAEPFRLRVLRALTESLEQINPDNNYPIDLRGAVFRGIFDFGDNHPLPMLAIMDGKEPGDVTSVEDRQSSDGMIFWPIYIQGFVEDDHLNPSDPAEIVLACVKERLGYEKGRTFNTWASPLGLGAREVPGDSPNSVSSLDFGFGNVRMPDEFTSDKTYFWIPLTIELSEDRSRPFA